MVAPLIPYTKTYRDFPTTFKRVVGYRQTPPYNLVSAARIESSSGEGTDCRAWNWGPTDLAPSGDSSLEVRLTNAVYASLVNQLGESSSFGATLTAELKQTLGLVTGTTLRLVGAARAIVALDFRRAASLLGLPYRERTIYKSTSRKIPGGKRKYYLARRRVFTLPSGREVDKTLANGWLMYSYGVKPLVEDIYNAMDVLQRPLPDVKIRATRTGSSARTVIVPGWPWIPHNQTWKAKVRIRSGADVFVENPNLWLLNQMGLINPVQWANEAVRLSFVVDWFSNLSQVIGSLTDFVGLRLDNCWISKLFVLEENFNQYGDYPLSWSKRRAIYLRDLVLVKPKLHFAYERFEPQRALNAVSLLIGLLPSR